MSVISMEQFEKRMADSAKARKAPIFGQFELTGRCNLDCKMCYVHNLDVKTCLKRELSTEEWKGIFDQAFDHEMLFATLTGGECLLRPDFKELYLHLWNKRILVSVLTNGTLIDESYVEFFKKYKPWMIQISLYGSDEAGYLRVTGHHGFEKTVSAIRALQEADVPVEVVTTPNHYMGDDYVNIIRYCKENKFNFVPGEMLLSPNRDDPEKNDYYLTMEEIVALAKARTQLYRPLCSVENTPEPCGPCTKAPVQGLTCSGGTCLAYVTWDGKMYPCISVMLGGFDVRRLGYAEAWKRTVAEAATVIYGAECVDCPYDKVCPKCPELRLTGLHTGHCKPEVCELTRRLVAAGVTKLDVKSEDCNH